MSRSLSEATETDGPAPATVVKAGTGAVAVLAEPPGARRGLRGRGGGSAPRASGVVFFPSLRKKPPATVTWAVNVTRAGGGAVTVTLPGAFRGFRNVAAPPVFTLEIAPKTLRER